MTGVSTYIVHGYALRHGKGHGRGLDMNKDIAREVVFRIARAGVFPRSSLLGAGQLGFWEFGKGGTVGEGWGK